MAEAPLYTCMVKGTDRASGPPASGMLWVTSRRGSLRIYADRIELGDWTIPHAAVREAKAYRFPTLFGRAIVLEIRTDDRSYQFGFNPWARPVAHLPYGVPIEEAALGVTPASVALRLGIAGFLLYNAVDALEHGEAARFAIDVVLSVLLVGSLVAAVARKLAAR